HGSRRTFGRAAVATLVVLTAIVAILGGMVIGSGLSGKLSPSTAQAGNSTSNGNGTAPTVPSNPGGGSSNSPFFGNGGSSSSGSADQGPQNNGSSSSLSTAAARVQPGVVNIVT